MKNPIPLAALSLFFAQNATAQNATAQNASPIVVSPLAGDLKLRASSPDSLDKFPLQTVVLRADKGEWKIFSW